MPNSNIIKTSALFVIFSITNLARAADDASASFITARFVRCWEDGAGNTSDDIVVSNTHRSKAIRASVEWISGPRERGKDVDLEPGEQKTIARDQPNARDVRVEEARFK
jgi:hypothetical protein